MRTIGFATVLIVSAAAASAQPAMQAQPKPSAAITAAVRSAHRSDVNRQRDDYRHPAETLAFFGVKPTDTVVEFSPGGGWYTKLLAPVLRDRGELFVAVGAGRVEEQLLSQDGFDKVEVLAKNTKIERAGPYYTMDSLNLGVKRVDMVLTFRNMHNFDAKSRAMMNEAVYTALKRGGLYGVVDHTRRHMQKDDNENRRRMDPVLAIKEVQAAGFELVDYSDLHYRLDDELRYEVGRRSVSGNTDRWTLLFKKP